MSFICMRMKNDFHIKGWAPNLVLKQRPGGTRKWPINKSVLPRAYVWISLNLDNFGNGFFFLPFSLPFTRKRRFRAPGRRFKNTGFSFMYQTRSDLSLIHVVRNIERFTYVANVGTKKTFSKEQASTPTGLSWYTIMVITPCENALLGVTIHKLVF